MLGPCPAWMRHGSDTVRSRPRESGATRGDAARERSLVELFEVALEAVDHWRSVGLQPGQVMLAMRRPALVGCGWGAVMEAVIAEQRWMGRLGQ